MEKKWQPVFQLGEKEALFANGKKSIEIFLTNTHDLNAIHGGGDESLENVIYTLLDRGVNADNPEFVKTFSPLLSLFPKLLYNTENCIFYMADKSVTGGFKYKKQDEFNFSFNFSLLIIANLLAAAGFMDESLLKLIKFRLDVLNTFCSKNDFDIYATPGTYQGVPKPFRDIPLVKTEITSHGNYKIPLIYDMYDMYGYKTLYAKLPQAERQKIDTVINYILAPEYQKLRRGYGLLKSGPSHYYTFGWDVILPIQPESAPLTNQTLHRLELLVNFPTAISHPWVKQNINLLQTYRNADGTYTLPREALPQKHSYWLGGLRTSLGENRRTKIGWTQNSTYRVNRILSTYIKNSL